MRNKFFESGDVGFGEKEMSEEAEAWSAELPVIMRILAGASAVEDTDGLLSLLKSEVADLLHHEALVCGVQVLSSSSGTYVHNILNWNFPDGYGYALATSEERADSPLMRRWRATRDPVLFQGGRDDEKYPAEWVSVFKKYELRNIIGHGILDVQGTFGSYFVFARLPGEVGDRESFLLELITPHLHLALMRTIAADQAFGVPENRAPMPLSPRQLDVLRCINQGKTNKEIAQILSMTGKNVKYHIEQIFTKLAVRNRAQAVSKALLLGLLK
jgi:LuxR family transcriptional regulator, quorum-sensing system regulator CviR